MYPNPHPEQTVPVEAAVAPKPTAERVRVLFYLPGAHDPAANLWVDVAALDDGKTLVTLLHDYPDFHPAADWRIEGTGALLTILSASGRTLTCAKAHGGEA